MTSTLNLLDATELAPVREALLRRAHDEAEAELAAAEREADGVTGAASDEAAQLLDRAKAQAAEDIAALESAERSRVLRDARSVQLQARRAAYDALMSAATATVRDQLAHDVDVVAALSDRARTELGAGATLTSIADGGLVAEADGRRLTLPLRALVERTVADLIASRASR